ncbi:hypothetical protein K3495_g3034 [Podosphaera aphanis]|nr:hypothetical protein K3495_g3034 [Podosphaera aphanis]
MRVAGDQKWPPLLVTRVFDENKEDIDVPDSLRIKVKKTMTWLDWYRALGGSLDGVYRWALEKDWTFKLPAIEAANEPEVQTIQCYADLRAMLKHLTDEEELGGTNTVAHKEDLPRDIDGSDEEILFQ